jgi:hypothetical protein
MLRKIALLILMSLFINLTGFNSGVARSKYDEKAHLTKKIKAGIAKLSDRGESAR